MRVCLAVLVAAAIVPAALAAEHPSVRLVRASPPRVSGSSSACGQIVVTAIGARRDRAAWKSPPPSCGTQVQP